jgi:signal transduction histidine kinase
VSARIHDIDQNPASPPMADSSQDQGGPSDLDSLWKLVERRMGVCPSFFKLAQHNPPIAWGLFRLAEFAYLDSPMPALFKELLFTYLSRFCEVRYCVARHCAFLMGRGFVAGDPACPPVTADEAIALLQEPLPREEELPACFRALEESAEAPLTGWPDFYSKIGQQVRLACAMIFIEPAKSGEWIRPLKRLLGAERHEQLMLFLAFIRTAHFWTHVHPELTFEPDVEEIVREHEKLGRLLMDESDCPAWQLRAALSASERRYQQLAGVLQETDRRKSEFLAILAHELRGPLAPIRNAVQVLRRSPDEETVQRTTDMLERQVGQMVRLVDDLLDVSRISRAKIELRVERIEVAPVLQNAVEAVRTLYDTMGHDLTVELPTAPIYLTADGARLSQVVGNLLSNAAKFTPRGGRISLTLARRSDEASIRVKDSGVGIAPDQLQRIFEMFAQVDTTLERSQGGLGIGLTLVKSLVEMHGGTIEAHSSGLGCGSEFTVRLPLAHGAPH